MGELEGLFHPSGRSRVPEHGGKPLSVENLRRRHPRPVLGEIGAEWGGFHSMRHSFASLKLAAGAPITEVSALLGHSSARVTLTVYAHWLDRDSAEAPDLDHELAEGGRRWA